MELVQDLAWDAFAASLRQLSNDVQEAEVQGHPLPGNGAFLSLARQYFREIAPELRALAPDPQAIHDLEEGIEALIQLALGEAETTSMRVAVETVLQQTTRVALARERRFSDLVFEESISGSMRVTDHEERLIQTIQTLVPSAARSYRQAIVDSADGSRVSYRGPANEFREALREVLDHLAPDDDVTSGAGFVFEDGQNKPTRAQKVRYLLRARREPKAVVKFQEDSTEIIEAKVAGITGATFSLANETAHLQMAGLEVQRVRRYMRLVLSELLAIPE